MPFLHTEYSLKECPFFSSPGPLKRTLDGILGAVSFLYSVQILRTLRMGCLPPSLLVQISDFGSIFRYCTEQYILFSHHAQIKAIP